MKQFIGISGFELKVAAIIAMTCNHVAHEFGSLMPEWLDFLLYSVGGTTFPIMAFLLVEGYLHTSSLKRYATRLAVFAVIAQVPYSLLWGPLGNVLFTLLVGLGVLWATDKYGQSGATAAILICGVLLSTFLDWGLIGPVVVYMFYAFRKSSLAKMSAERCDACESAAQFRKQNARGIVLTMIVPLVYVVVFSLSPFNLNDIGYAFVGFTIATVLLCLYSGQRGHSMKWFFYAYYPLHLFVIWMVGYFML